MPRFNYEGIRSLAYATGGTVAALAVVVGLSQVHEPPPPTCAETTTISDMMKREQAGAGDCAQVVIGRMVLKYVGGNSFLAYDAGNTGYGADRFQVEVPPAVRPTSKVDADFECDPGTINNSERGYKLGACVLPGTVAPAHTPTPVPTRQPQRAPTQPAQPSSGLHNVSEVSSPAFDQAHHGERIRVRRFGAHIGASNAWLADGTLTTFLKPGPGVPQIEVNGPGHIVCGDGAEVTVPLPGHAATLDTCPPVGAHS